MPRIVTEERERWREGFWPRSAQSMLINRGIVYVIHVTAQYILHDCVTSEFIHIHLFVGIVLVTMTKYSFAYSVLCYRTRVCYYGVTYTTTTACDTVMPRCKRCGPPQEIL